MISIQNIYKSYGKLPVLKGVNLEVGRGEVVAIVGASGAGKSTLLQILGTLDKQDSGSITIDGKSTADFKDKDLSVFRNKNIGFIFQFHHLLPEFTALENVCIPGFIQKRSKQEVEEKALQLLTTLGLQERAHHKPSELSGGEQQRVAVCRALINNPAIILADEPSGNLDSSSAKELHELFFTLRDQLQQTFVVVTHNETLANMADRRLVMQDGVIV